MKLVYVETYGCQMNVADSALMEHVLAEAGYGTTDRVSRASVILVNTCAVREKAADRVVRRLESLSRLKRVRPDLILGIAGCVPKHQGEELRRRLPAVDLLVGPDSYRRLPQLLEAAAQKPVSDLRLDLSEDYRGCDPVSVQGVSSFVPIMRGCDRFCTFCVVPLTRGREKSLPLPEVLRQAAAAMQRGAREITLLGQTVNSWRHGEHRFSDLLRATAALDPGVRVRFTSPHPADFREEDFRALAEVPNLCPHLHLPLQSGSSRVLAAMKRGYTREEYLRIVERVRSLVPEVGLTTDLLVGFPGEEDEDFEDTMSLMRTVGFDGAFLFRYSERSGTFAARHQPDAVPDEVKGERLERVIGLQEEISLRRYRRFAGREVEVLIEGPSRRNPDQCVGKAPDFKRVVLPAGPAAGSVVTVEIERASSHSLFAAGLTGSGEDEEGEAPAQG